MNSVSIYVLIDPITCKIRYVGRTSNELNVRLNGHIHKSKMLSTHKDYWIQKLLKLGKRPIIKEFKIVIGWEESYVAEKDLIQRCIKFGINLLNHDDRGIGGINKIIDQKQRDKISDTLKKGYRENRIQPTRTSSVVLFDKDLNFIAQYNSIASCCRDNNFPVSAVEKVFSWKRKHKNKYKDYYIYYTNQCPYKIG